MIILLVLPIIGFMYFFGVLYPLKWMEDYGPGTYNWKKRKRAEEAKALYEVLQRRYNEVRSPLDYPDPPGLDRLLEEKLRRDLVSPSSLRQGTPN